MTFTKLYPHQEEALTKLKSGSILCGGVGTGKTLTALSFYQRRYWSHGELKLIVITTAKKRDSGDWEDEAELLGLEANMIVDSWNNIDKYATNPDAFFIFDEQRVVGYGKWAKSFIKIARSECPWLLLTATPGDTWMDYIPVFIANGFYKNKTEFIRRHVEYEPYTKYPKIKAYHDTNHLHRLRNLVLVNMPMTRKTTRHVHHVICDYNHEWYQTIVKRRWNVFKDEPIENTSEYTQCLRRAVSASQDRLRKAAFYISVNPKVIVFYNYDYELEMLQILCTHHEEQTGTPYAEYNGHKHQEIPDANSWVYLVQYTAGAEGWNCTDTDTIIFYSPNYSYKILEQSMGRIDRLNTSFKDLDYIQLRSNAPIDKAVIQANVEKRIFNESAWRDGNGKRVKTRTRLSKESNQRDSDPFSRKYRIEE